MLSKEQVLEYKNQLEKERVRLLAQLKQYEKPQDFGSDIDGLEEEAEEAEEFGNRRAVEQAIRDEINEIDAALNKVQLNTYGICNACGREISERVLNLVPESLLCEHCKKTPIDAKG